MSDHLAVNRAEIRQQRSWSGEPAHLHPSNFMRDDQFLSPLELASTSRTIEDILVTGEMMVTQIEQAREAVRHGHTERAVGLLQRAGDGGDADAWLELAFWHLQGRNLPRDLARARALFGKAAALQHSRGRMIYLSLLANGTGGRADFAAARNLLADAAAMGDAGAKQQLRLLEAMNLTGTGDPVELPPAKILSDAPEVTLIPKLFAVEECNYLIQAAEPAFRPAIVGHAATGQQTYNQVRTCDVAVFPWVAENPVIHALNRRLAAASNSLVACGEPMQILRYRSGQEFKPHRDCTEATDNQRVLTMLVYLNDGYGAGETSFLKPGLKIKGNTGDALLFRNASDLGEPDPDSLHAGLPVTSGIKIVASRWIRQKPFGPIPQ